MEIKCVRELRESKLTYFKLTVHKISSTCLDKKRYMGHGEVPKCEILRSFAGMVSTPGLQRCWFEPRVVHFRRSSTCFRPPPPSKNATYPFFLPFVLDLGFLHICYSVLHRVLCRILLCLDIIRSLNTQNISIN